MALRLVLFAMSFVARLLTNMLAIIGAVTVVLIVLWNKIDSASTMSLNDAVHSVQSAVPRIIGYSLSISALFILLREM